MAAFSERLHALIFSEKWNIGYVKQSAESLVVNKGLKGEINWFREDGVDTLADPFVFYTEKELRIVYEEIKRFKENGELYMITNFDMSTKTKVHGLEPKNVHYSYPYVIKDGLNTYCIPETSCTKKVFLYEIDPTNSTRFRKVKTLLSGKEYVDTSIVKYKDLFWLFTICKQDPSKLWIYYSDKVDGDYQPHRASPITVDPTTSRGAGNIFMVNDVLYRPTQNHAVDYGGSVILNRINELSEHTYREEHLFEIKPVDPYPAGLHHVSVGDNLIVIDGKKTRFILENIWKKLQRKLMELIIFLPIMEI